LHLLHQVKHRGYQHRRMLDFENLQDFEILQDFENISPAVFFIFWI
jgi:hypothetical protein